MKFDCDDFRILEGKKAKLDKRPTTIEPLYKSRKHYLKLIEKRTAELSEQQSMLYASNNHALLLIFQAMDAAGNDSVIEHVMKGLNPQGCDVYSFNQPSQ